MKKTKRLWSVVLVIAMVACMMIGCGSKEESSGSDSKGGDKKVYEVACILRISDMYAAWMKTAFEADAEKYGNINVTVLDNQDDSAKHIELIETCIEQQYDYIVLQGRQGDFTDLYNKAKKAGIKLIQINFGEDWSHEVLHTILCDDYELGKIIAERAAEELPENAKVCFLNGPAGIWVTDLRRDGFEDGLLKARPDIELLDEQDAGFVKDTAMNKTADWLQMYDQIDAILSASDSMAVGAIEAFKANGRDTGTCKFYGIDGLTEACSAIVDGNMSCSALQDATSYSQTALDMVAEDIEGKIDLNECVGSDDKAITYFMPKLIDSTNAQEQYDYYKENGLVN